jgi:hypothetical protein
VFRENLRLVSVFSFGFCVGLCPIYVVN